MNNSIFQRILSGWTFIRGIYLAMGAFVMIQAIMEGQWFGIILGGYFTAMAVFNYGCAAGACYTGYNQTAGKPAKATVPQDVEYEEVK